MVTIDIPLDNTNFATNDPSSANKSPIEFMICRKRDWKTKLTDMPYLKQFVAPTLAKNLKSDECQLIVLAEADDIASHIVDSQVGDILEKMGEKNVNMIHITDQKVYNNL